MRNNRNNITDNKYYGINILPTIPQSHDDIYIISNVGDRLDIMAHKYYNNTSY